MLLVVVGRRDIWLFGVSGLLKYIRLPVRKKNSELCKKPTTRDYWGRPIICVKTNSGGFYKSDTFKSKAGLKQQRRGCHKDSTGIRAIIRIRMQKTSH